MDFKNKVSLANAYFPNKASSTRNDFDYYPTPPIGTLALIKNHPIPEKIWECCAGRGHISAELIRNGHEVYSSDLYAYENPFVNVDYGIDFLTEKRHDVDGVITNPPFMKNLPEKLIYRMLVDHGYDFLAIFCRMTFMESARRYKLFTELPPSRVLIMSERVHCNETFMQKNNGIGGMVAMSWFIWDKSYPETNKVEWIKPSHYINELNYELKSE
jgi:hypothetical protein